DSRSYGSDAQIDDFIEQVAPFFDHGRITYVDVGAYVGEVFLKLQSSGRIFIEEAYLFEPNPESYIALGAAVTDVGGECSVTTYNIALGSRSEEKSFVAAKSMTKSIKAGERRPADTGI